MPKELDISAFVIYYDIYNVFLDYFAMVHNL